MQFAKTPAPNGAGVLFLSDISGVGGDRLCDKGTAANGAAFAQYGLAAENGSTCINGDIVFHRGVTLFVGQSLTAAGGKCTQCDTLIDLDVIADGSGFTDYDTGTVVNEEAFADSRTGVDVNAGLAVGIFGHHAGQIRHAHFI